MDARAFDFHDKLTIDLHSTGTNAVKDSAGNALDGEWTNSTSYVSFRQRRRRR